MASRVLASLAYTYVICGEGSTVSSLGRWSNVSAPALAARPDIATAGKAAAATTKPASSPHTSNEAALDSRLWSRLRIQVTPISVRETNQGRVFADARSLS